MADETTTRHTFPLVEERAVVERRVRETGRLRIRTLLDEREQWVSESLVRESASVERVPIGREVETRPAIRQEGDVLIVPVVEEVLVIEKRLMLKEELHVRRERRLERIEEPVTLRSARAIIERAPPGEPRGIQTITSEGVERMRTITAVFDSRVDAERAQARLRELGVSGGDIRIVNQQAAGTQRGDGEHKGMWESIKEFFVPDEDRGTYEESVRRGGHLLTARVADQQSGQAIRVLEESNAIDLDEREREWRAQGWNGAQGTPVEGEERIPVVEERLVVGKREIGRGHVRVRSYLVEEPVREQVRLREEHAEVERRPVNQPVTSAREADELLRERGIDVSETTEEPVIGKEAVVKEELTVRKRAGERVENVEDKVRRTEVDVEDTRGSQTPRTRPGKREQSDRPRH